MFFTRYTVRFASHEEITVVEVDDCESLAIKKAQNIMRRNKRILNEDVLATAKVVYVEGTNPLVCWSLYFYSLAFLIMQSIKAFSIVESEGIHCDVFYEAGNYYASVIQYNRTICTYGPNKNKESVIKEAIQAFNFNWELSWTALLHRLQN